MGLFQDYSSQTDASLIWFFSRSVPLEYKHFLYICFPSSWFLARVSHFSCFLFLWFALLLAFWNMSPAHFLSPTIGLSLVWALVFLCAHSWSFSSTFAVSLQFSSYCVDSDFPFLLQLPTLPSLHPFSTSRVSVLTYSSGQVALCSSTL